MPVLDYFAYAWKDSCHHVARESENITPVVTFSAGCEYVCPTPSRDVPDTAATAAQLESTSLATDEFPSLPDPNAISRREGRLGGSDVANAGKTSALLTRAADEAEQALLQDRDGYIQAVIEKPAPAGEKHAVNSFGEHKHSRVDDGSALGTASREPIPPNNGLTHDGNRCTPSEPAAKGPTFIAKSLAANLREVPTLELQNAPGERSHDLHPAPSFQYVVSAVLPLVEQCPTRAQGLQSSINKTSIISEAHHYPFNPFYYRPQAGLAPEVFYPPSGVKCSTSSAARSTPSLSLDHSPLPVETDGEAANPGPQCNICDRSVCKYGLWKCATCKRTRCCTKCMSSYGPHDLRVDCKDCRLADLVQQHMEKERSSLLTLEATSVSADDLSDLHVDATLEDECEDSLHLVPSDDQVAQPPATEETEEQDPMGEDIVVTFGCWTEQRPRPTWVSAAGEPGVRLQQSDPEPLQHQCPALWFARACEMTASVFPWCKWCGKSMGGNIERSADVSAKTLVNKSSVGVSPAGGLTPDERDAYIGFTQAQRDLIDSIIKRRLSSTAERLTPIKQQIFAGLSQPTRDLIDGIIKRYGNPTVATPVQSSAPAEQDATYAAQLVSTSVPTDEFPSLPDPNAISRREGRLGGSDVAAGKASATSARQGETNDIKGKKGNGRRQRQRNKRPDSGPPTSSSDSGGAESGGGGAHGGKSPQSPQRTEPTSELTCKWPEPPKWPKDFEQDEHETLVLTPWIGTSGILADWRSDAEGKVAIHANRGKYTDWICWWFWQVEAKADPAQFRDIVPGTYTLDRKLYRAILDLEIPQDLKDEIVNEALDCEDKTGRVLSGRYALWQLIKSATHGDEWEYLHRHKWLERCKLIKDDLVGFSISWGRLLRTFETLFEEHEKREWLRRALGRSAKLKRYTDAYDDAEPGDEDYSRVRSYNYLWSSLQRVMDRERMAYNRAVVEADLRGDKPPPEFASNAVIQAVPCRPESKDSYCRFWQRDKCRNGDTCAYKHIIDPGPKGSKAPAKAALTAESAEPIAYSAEPAAKGNKATDDEIKYPIITHPRPMRCEPCLAEPSSTKGVSQNGRPEARKDKLRGTPRAPPLQTLPSSSPPAPPQQQPAFKAVPLPTIEEVEPAAPCRELLLAAAHLS